MPQTATSPFASSGSSASRTSTRVRWRTKRALVDEGARHGDSAPSARHDLGVGEIEGVLGYRQQLEQLFAPPVSFTTSESAASTVAVSVLVPRISLAAVDFSRIDIK